MTDRADEGQGYVLFTLAEATYALPTSAIRQLDLVGAVTPVPNAPPYLAGIVSVRGEVLPAVDLRTRFGFPRGERTLRSRLLVVRAGERTVGFIVDTAREFAHIPPEAIHAPPDTIAGGTRRYLRGVAQLADRLVLVLEAAELFSADEDRALTAPADAGAQQENGPWHSGREK